MTGDLTKMQTGPCSNLCGRLRHVAKLAAARRQSKCNSDLVVLDERGEVPIEGGRVGGGRGQPGGGLVADIGQLGPQQRNGAPQLDEAGNNPCMRPLELHQLFCLHKISHVPLHARTALLRGAHALLQ